MISPADYILLAGWRLCAITTGKGPTYPGWSTRDGSIDDAGVAATLTGCGLLHAYSGTCALDIDDLAKAMAWCAERGIMLKDLLSAPDAVHILSGRPGRDKLLYRLTTPLRSIKPDGSGLELRCAASNGNSVQDALPPTIHPLTKKPYEWRGDWTALPPLPAALLHAWRELVGSPAGRPEETPATRSEDVAYLDSLVQGRDPSASYDDWLKIGMRLHHATQGQAIGLSVWNRWSKQGKNYKGLDDLKAHWVSFRVDHPAPLTAAALEDARPAQPDEFENETPIEAPAVQQSDSEVAAELCKRLPFVESIQKFFDLKTGNVIHGSEALYAHFASKFTAKRGRKSRIDVFRALAENKNKIIAANLEMHPGEGVLFMRDGAMYVNKYRGKLPEPLAPTTAEREALAWWFGRIKDPVFRNYLLDFYACIVQRPGTKIRSAPLMWSRTQGNGKSLMLEEIPKSLVGHQYSYQVNTAMLESQYNGFLLDHWHLMLSEIKIGNKRDALSVMANIKQWFTDSTVTARPMYMPHVQIPNRFFITAASNEPDAVPIDEHDRRFVIHNLQLPPLTPDEGERAAEMIKGPRAPGVLCAYFMERDISRFNPDAAAPKTMDKTAMIDAVRGDDDIELERMYEERIGVFQRDAARLSDIRAELMALVRHPVSPARVGVILGRFATFKRTKKARIWIWRNVDKWLLATPNELEKYVDIQPFSSDSV